MKITGHRTDVMFERYNAGDTEDAHLATKLHEEYVTGQKITSRSIQESKGSMSTRSNEG